MNEKKIVAVGKVFKPTGEIIKEGFEGYYQEYIFDDREIELLCEGEEIIAETIDLEAILGRLEKIDGHFKYVIAIPKKTKDHVWTKDEKKLLYDGLEIEVKDFYDPKTCSTFTSKCRWNANKREIELL